MAFQHEIRQTDQPSLKSYQQGLAVLRAFTGKAVGPPDNRDFALLITAPRRASRLCWAGCGRSRGGARSMST
jgi:hypothetical protein